MVFRFSRFERIWYFIFPQPHWGSRLVAYLAGCASWPWPNGKGKLGPWPLLWLPHETGIAEDDETKTEIERKSSFRLLPGECYVTKKVLPPGEIACCCRCGVPLSYAEAGVEWHPAAAPSCRACRPLIRFVSLFG